MGLIKHTLISEEIGIQNHPTHTHTHTHTNTRKYHEISPSLHWKAFGKSKCTFKAFSYSRFPAWCIQHQPTSTWVHLQALHPFFSLRLISLPLSSLSLFRPSYFFHEPYVLLHFFFLCYINYYSSVPIFSFSFFPPFFLSIFRFFLSIFLLFIYFLFSCRPHLNSHPPASLFLFHFSL